ncbi:MAG: efflux RND transporter periplasmic adaptor subunit [Pirellulaceae bacterium]
MKSLLCYFSLISLLAAPLLTGCRGQQEPASSVAASAETEQKIEVTRVIAATLPRSMEVPASVEPYERVKIMSRLEGHVKTVNVDIGDQVKLGDLLATLQVQELHDEVTSRSEQKKQAEAEVKSQEAAIAVAQANVEQTRAGKRQFQALLTLRSRELARITGLVNNGALRKEKMEEAQFALQSVQASLDKTAADIVAAEKEVAKTVAGLEAAKAGVAVATAELSKSTTMAGYTSIRAPFDGLITQRLANTGSLVLPASDPTATALFEIITDQRMRVVSFLPMEAAGLVDNGDPVEISRLQGLAGVTLAATVTRHARAFHRGARMMRVEMDVTNPIQVGDRQFTLKSGDYGFAVIDLHAYEQVSTIPQSALSMEQSKTGKSHVIVVNASKQCSKQEVQMLVKYKNPGGIPVVGVTGLAPGQQVISAGVASWMSTAEKNQSLPAAASLVEKPLQISP